MQDGDNISEFKIEDQKIIENTELNIWEALIPVFALVGMLAYNIYVYGDDALSGSNQFILLLGAAVAAIVGFKNKVSYKRMLEEVAENVKVRHGNLVESSNEVVELPIIGDEETRNGVSLEVVHSVIFSRVEEALMILVKSLEKSALKEQIGAGIILTGGMTKLKGMRELAQAIFTGMPVRVGYPDNVNGLFDELKDPAFSTVVGLLLYKAGGHTQYEIDFQQELLHSKAAYEENLNDIRIGHKSNDAEESHSSKGHQEEKEHNKKEKEESVISFDDLPDLGHENKNPFKKLANWARQLF